MIAASIILALVSAFSVFMARRHVEPTAPASGGFDAALHRAGLLRWWWFDETWGPHGPYFTRRAARADLLEYARYLFGSRG